MKFDAANGDKGIVVDADGRNIPRPVSGDTETGVVLCQVLDGGGNPVFGETEAAKERRQYKAPLHVLPLYKGFDAKKHNATHAPAPYERLE